MSTTSEFDDAEYHLGRAALLLKQNASLEATEDAVVQFAFGAEKFAKAVLRTVNPAFELESIKFDDVAPLLYTTSMLTKYQQSAGDGGAKEAEVKRSKNRVVSLQDSLIRSKWFSQTVDQYFGTLQKIGVYRSTIAHRKRCELHYAEIEATMLGTFYPIVDSMAKERSLDRNRIFGQREEELRRLSEGLASAEKRKLRIEETLKKCFDIWDKNRDNQNYVNNSKLATEREKEHNTFVSELYQVVPCPACSNEAILNFGYTGSMRGTHFDLYNIGIDCFYCGLSIYDPEDLDYLRQTARLK